MKQLIAIMGLSWASCLWAQDENVGNEVQPVLMPAEQAEHFDILQLPKGASVVLPRPASTLSPLNIQVQVSATDRRQILKIGALSRDGSTKAVKLAVYDPHQPRVKYLSIRPGSFVLYHFKNLSTIRLAPQESRDAGLRQTLLLLESNRPMGVSY